MSSVTRFLRQIPTGLTYYKIQGDLEEASGVFFKLVPAAGNFVGNYPPGAMEDVTGAVVQGISGENFILRDMGKTVHAETIGESVELGFFRQMQLQVPSSTAISGVIGGPEVPVAGAPYYTVYLPVPVTGAGVILPAGLSLVPIAGGQM
jgi:hypothetical protein